MVSDVRSNLRAEDALFLCHGDPGSTEWVRWAAEVKSRFNGQFVGGADLERPIDATVELTRQTGRFLFVRGTLEQAGDMVSSFMGILRKPSP